MSSTGSTSAAESPGGVPAELRRIQARVSDLQERFKTTALAHGYGRGMIQPAWAPFVSLYVTAWIPLVLRWQAFYQAYKDWTGHPYQWTHQAELDHLLRDVEEVGSQVNAVDPTAPSPSSDLDPDPGTGQGASAPPPPPPPPHDATNTVLAVVAVASGALVLLALASRRGR